jgi:hypothetical protein
VETTVNITVSKNPTPPGNGGGISVSLTPPSAILSPGQQITLTATVDGTDNKKVSWSYSSGGGSSGGQKLNYTAPSALGVYIIKATSVADSTKSASAMITVTGKPSNQIVVTITPDFAVLKRGLSQTFTATVKGTTNTDVILGITPLTVSGQGTQTFIPSKKIRIQEADGGVATVLEFTMPSNSTQDYEISAISDADQTKKATARVKLDLNP